MTFKLGRKRPHHAFPRLNFGDYLWPKKMKLHFPRGGDYRAAAAPALANIYENDRLGDCVIAAMAHIEGVLSGNAGDLVTYSNVQIIAEYGVVGGYVPGHPETDNGCDEVTALNEWFNHGFPPGQHKIAGWMAVNANDPAEYKAALYLFENLFFGVELPDAWISPFPSASGFTWDVAGNPDPNNGHAFCGTAWNRHGVFIDTWGMSGFLTDAAIQKYAGGADGGNLYAVISRDGIAKATAKAPNGLDFAQLLADFERFGGVAA